MHEQETGQERLGARMTMLNLILLPHAGGSAASFQGWKPRLPGWINPIPVDLPGHGARHGQPALRDWPLLVELLLTELGPHLLRPFAVFGHSMGGLVGLELAHAARARLGRIPVWFGASGCKAPSRRDRETKWLDCPEQEVLDELHRLGGTPPEVFASRELLDLVLPVLRADFHLCGIYDRPPHRAPLASRLLVLGGMTDDASHPPENLSDWAAEIAGPHRVEMIEGGHFFIDSRRDQVLRLVSDGLAEAIGRSLVASDAGRLAIEGAPP
jgi:surfactin synthase thioesterase subunit